ncbi:MAG: ribosome small subunit-dependent GTPase A [Candidatus Hydrogenedentota bacterium]|nr:MAG: ribosome small subunit-dependent GTPase A [Candidatus Hydrogenedentota bacterium]
MDLTELGWDSFFDGGFLQYKNEGLIPARVGREDRQTYLLLSEPGELIGLVSGRFSHEANSKSEFPGVGDWVAARKVPDEDKAIIQAVLPRKSCFARQPPSGGTEARTEAQVVAANIDTVFIVSGLDGGRAFNLRRIERYLALAWESGASPVVVLNKVDVCSDVEAYVREAETVAFGIPIYPVSATESIGLDLLRGHFKRGSTAVLLGSSGVGKSALVNALLSAERQATSAVREHDLRGRHTTTRREMIFLPNGGIIIDTPGMRELRMWGDERSVNDTFSEIEELATKCRFRDCNHQGEPGCAVQRAIDQGNLDADRFGSFQRLQREIAHLARRKDQNARLEEKAREKKFSRMVRQILKNKEDKA